MKAHLLFLAIAGIIFSGCVSQPLSTISPAGPSESLFGTAPAPLTASLFPSDETILGDEAVAKILSSKVQLPTKIKIAIMKFPDESSGARYYGRYYWRDEQYLKLQQAQIDTLSDALTKSGAIIEVTPLPSLMTPKQASIPILREAAVRMQADLLLVFRIGSDTYTQYRTFSKDQVKAYSTCEMVLLDVRTGLVPFTRVISREQLEQKQSSDLDLAETMRRAEQESAVNALQAAGGDLVNFIKNTSKSDK